MEESTIRREAAPPTSNREPRPPRARPGRLARATVAVGLGVGLVVGTSSIAHAAEVTAPVPLDELGPGPVSVLLDHGVTASVDAGAWTPPQGYVVFPGQSQTWTFSEPVALRFGVAGLNHVGECVALPVGIAVESIHADHDWDEVTRQVCRTAAANPAAESVFVLAGPVLDLTWTPVGGGPNTGRGPTFLEVTVERDPAVVTDDAASTVAGTPTAIDLTANDPGRVDGVRGGRGVGRGWFGRGPR